LGLIVNEIATNTIKHGIKAEGDTTFTIELTENKMEDQYILTLSNTGKPFPKDINLDNPETLGLRLISTLVEQIGGTIEMQREPHPVFTIRFPIEENS
jgi:two-component sensor histidine kinase